MPRSLWNGTISFGQVHVPVKLYSAVQSKTVHFREVHLEDGARVEHRRFCSAEDREVPYEEVVKGNEVAPDEYVVLSQDEVKAAAGSRTHIVDVEHFVPAAEIDPVFYSRTYVLGARDGGEDGYRLLHDALERTGRAAIGRFTFHNREYLAAIRPHDGLLALHTMRFADEVRSPQEIEVDEPAHGPGEREIEMAGQLVESLHRDFDATAYEDSYRQAVLELIERKAAGEEIEAPAPARAEASDDLLAALEASLAGAKGEKAGAR